MRLLALALIVLGIIALAVPSVTFFTQERVADAGFFHIDVSRPHTVFFNPALGIAALAAGVVLLITDRRRGSAL